MNGRKYCKYYESTWLTNDKNKMLKMLKCLFLSFFSYSSRFKRHTRTGIGLHSSKESLRCPASGPLDSWRGSTTFLYTDVAGAIWLSLMVVYMEHERRTESKKKIDENDSILNLSFIYCNNRILNLLCITNIDKNNPNCLLREQIIYFVTNKCHLRGRKAKCYELTHLCAKINKIYTRSNLAVLKGEGLSLNPKHWLSHTAENSFWQYGTCFTKLLPLYLTLMVNHNLPTSLKGLTTARHLHLLSKKRLMHDVEVNPGPTGPNGDDLSIITLNCRGLNKLKKFRLLLKNFNKVVNTKCKAIVMLQETMVKDSWYLDTAWKGKYVFTPGLGNSQGCITLLHYDSVISNIKHLDNRGHIFDLEGLTEGKACITNIYAPNSYGNEKSQFFNTVTENIELRINTGIHNILLAGDFNLTLNNCDRLNRDPAPREELIGNTLTSELTRLGMHDAWQGHSGYTWKRGKVMSKLDRIYYRTPGLRHTRTEISWTLCNSDHAAVQASFQTREQNVYGRRPTRLDPTVVKNNEKLLELKAYLVQQLATLNANANPHVKLEFAKMTIRTKALELGKQILKAEEIRLKNIEEDIEIHTRLLRQCDNHDEAEEISYILESRTAERNELLEQQGERLAWKCKTRWFNEGEKSNKYFLNLLKRNNNKEEMVKLQTASGLTSDPSEIKTEIKTYYSNLYNNNHQPDIDEHFLANMFELDQGDTTGLTNPLTTEELWAALKPLKDTAPGPDGIPHSYLKKLWDVLGPIIAESWNYSLTIKKMPPSHYGSFLKLIPKADKDKTCLKNWRPITLSNCDHKLITRVYNQRLLNCISTHISSVQTAYIKGRNITDNIRLLNSAIQLSHEEPDIHASIIALDAQKAFDSVSHDYIGKLLEKIGVADFKQIFHMLYDGLYNDIIINGRIEGSHKISNGVKQGDALSCTLFLLAIEPLLRNVQRNPRIIPLRSTILQYEWPKILGYADDVTCIISDDQATKQCLFDEYERLTKASGLKLNADKTEIYNFSGANVRLQQQRTTRVNYLAESYEIDGIDTVKINGVVLSQNKQEMKQANTEVLISKMDSHFRQWAKRNLSLLGKIQIYKTFGLSQFLYHLAVFEPDKIGWKRIYEKINKFIWNKNYDGNKAPSRIKNKVTQLDVDKGGFGLTDIKQVVQALRLRRHCKLATENVHPLAELIRALTNDNEYLLTKTELEIEEITDQNVKTLAEKRTQDCCAPNWELETDLILHYHLLNSRIALLVKANKLESREMVVLRRLNINRLYDVTQTPIQAYNTLIKISNKKLTNAIKIIFRTYNSRAMPPNPNQMLQLRSAGGTWLNPGRLSSKEIRATLKGENNIALPRLLHLDDDIMTPYYRSIKKLQNVKNKARLLRLLHRDVYCGERLVKFGMSENDRCTRCFKKETIFHLLQECPYSILVWEKLSVNARNVEDIIGIGLSAGALEIRAEILSQLVFSKGVIPPEILVSITLEKFANKLVYKGTSYAFARRLITVQAQ
jgi:hypothetical protein